MFKKAQLIEKYGSGIKRIREGFATYGLLSPTFENFNMDLRCCSGDGVYVPPLSSLKIKKFNIKIRWNKAQLDVSVCSNSEQFFQEHVIFCEFTY